MEKKNNLINYEPVQTKPVLIFREFSVLIDLLVESVGGKGYSIDQVEMPRNQCWVR